jgi:very-short-patch-repair endonuclease
LCEQILIVLNDERVKNIKQKMSKIHNQKHLEERRKELRKNLTSAEATLWKSLQKKQLNGRKFRRQHSIQNFIVDFYCASENLIIELDGTIHLDFAQENYDFERTETLENLGFKIIRFENKLVFENLHDLLKEINNHFKTNSSSK